ncbi:hypothetical protein AMJ39_07060 [candidate division TA06 bacterium DG_24]|nr:MAG: hypothetical protein AMJ39_07060 [candidate division TA06 bacterium DG_24]KPL08927.1 MAG: hypothetical protein AMJ71_07760 [candidate division TA06 bacterium SM1_40]
MSPSTEETIVTIMRENASPAYLATCDGDQPRVRPVTPIVEDDMSVWVATFCTSRKVRQIKKNPNICLAFVELPRGDKAATLLGRCEIVNDMKQKKRVWSLATFDLSQHFPQGPEMEEYCVLRIIIDKIEWRESWTSKLEVYEPAQ